MPAPRDQGRRRDDDVAAIGRLIGDIERGFNTNDIDLSSDHFTPDATAVTVSGVVLDGRDAIREAARAGFAGPLRDEHARYVIDDVVFPRPDVAIAHKRAEATTAEGNPIEGAPRMIALYVFVKHDGRWQVAARQNTMVAT